MEQENTSDTTMKNQKSQENQRPNETTGWHFEGHIKIFDPETGEVFQDKRNAIHYENMSVAMVNALSNQGQGWIYQMAFGSGGTTVDPTGLITYLTPNTIGVNTGLYNQTYAKIVDQNATENVDPTRNKMEIRHVSGATYSDIVISCLLDYGEPVGQQAFDNSQDMNSNFVFDELGLKSYNSNGTGKLLTHVVFHPVQKSLNRLLQVDYTIRVQSLTGFTEV
jgi:TFIIF-interacting CTD phosphatase-like protein